MRFAAMILGLLLVGTAHSKAIEMGSDSSMFLRGDARGSCLGFLSKRWRRTDEEFPRYPRGDGGIETLG